MAPRTGPSPIYTGVKRDLSDDEIDVPPSSKRARFLNGFSPLTTGNRRQLQASTPPDTPSIPGTPQELGHRDYTPPTDNTSGETVGSSSDSVDIINLATLFRGDYPSDFLLNTLSSVPRITQQAFSSKTRQSESKLLRLPGVIDPASDTTSLDDDDQTLLPLSRFTLPGFLLGSNSVEAPDLEHDKGIGHADLFSRLDIGDNHEEEGKQFASSQAQDNSIQRLHDHFEADGFQLPMYDSSKASRAMSSSDSDDGAIEPFEGEDEEVLAEPDYSHLTNLKDDDSSVDVPMALQSSRSRNLPLVLHNEEEAERARIILQNAAPMDTSNSNSDIDLFSGQYYTWSASQGRQKPT